METVSVPAKCQGSGERFDMVFESRGDNWVAIDVVNVASASGGASGGGSETEEHSMRGDIVVGHDYTGCPHCGSSQFFKCGCGELSCYDGSEWVTCPWCDGEGRVQGSIDEMTGRSQQGTGGNSGGDSGIQKRDGDSGGGGIRKR